MIQKSELTQVPVEQRVPGQWYGVADDFDGELTTIVCWSGDGLDTFGVSWNYWFDIPESMIPVREVMPEVGNMYEYYSGGFDGLLCRLVGFQVQLPGCSDSITITSIHNVVIRPSLTIPSGSKSEQIEMLEKKLAELKQS